MRLSLKSAPLILMTVIFTSVLFGVAMLFSLSPYVFPVYGLIILFSIIAFFILQRFDFDFFVYTASFLYFTSIILLVIPILTGQITRGTIRWIEIGGSQIQPAEAVRVFLILFMAVWSSKVANPLLKLFGGVALTALPFVLILIQPSLGVATITAISMLSILFVSGVNPKHLLPLVLVAIFSAVVMLFSLAPYQRQRIESLFVGSSDPRGAGYQAIQSVIAVGSGQITGRGLGKGVQTQLNFLPERHTDFIFASISEELGLIGASWVILLVFFLPFILIHLSRLEGPLSAKLFLLGSGVSFAAQSFVHIGMNLKLLPITGLPLPLISYGGSSFLGSMLILGIALQAVRKLGKIQLI